MGFILVKNLIFEIKQTEKSYPLDSIQTFYYF